LLLFDAEEGALSSEVSHQPVCDQLSPRFFLAHTQRDHSIQLDTILLARRGNGAKYYMQVCRWKGTPLLSSESDSSLFQQRDTSACIAASRTSARKIASKEEHNTNWPGFILEVRRRWNNIG
jgi:hypothetical protein